MVPSNTLFVKHLPSELSISDREELLKLVGAVKVRVMPDNGKMKYTAFATFPSQDDAKHALSILHQKEMFGRRLVIEFAKEYQEKLIPHQSDHENFVTPAQKESGTKLLEKEILKLDGDDFSRKLHGIAPVLGLDYLPSPLLKYKYPPPTSTIIQNISHALASVPKFYTQVLHLMNKMNLPAPFGPLTPAPPLQPDPITNEAERINTEEDVLGEENMDTSEAESEFESDSDDKGAKVEKVLPQKRAIKKAKRAKKKPKLSDLVPVQVNTALRQRTEPSEVFESQPLTQKKISVKKIENIAPVEDSANYEMGGGFGAFEIKKETINEENVRVEPTEEILTGSKFISLKELDSKRLSSRERKSLSVFKNYSPGEPTCRLYIKNLAKQVQEKDLVYIYGRFIDPNSEQDKNMFNVTVMKEGRMKGQAFVTLSNEKQAQYAMEKTNGFLLHTKPLVVVFARSATKKDKPS